jgi:hypothetical protein
MSTITNYDNILTLPIHFVINIFNYFDTDMLLMLANYNIYSDIVCKVLKSKLESLNMRDLMRIYCFENIQADINIFFNKLSSSKYNMIKDVYRHEKEDTIINAIEILIANNFLEIIGQVIPENMNIIKQIDTIQAVLITDKFIELTNENGGPFNMFEAMQNNVERKIITICVKMVNYDIYGHTYLLNISSGFSINKCRVSRGPIYIGQIDYNYIDIFCKLRNSINNDYSFDNIKIKIQSIGNNTLGPVQEITI